MELKESQTSLAENKNEVIIITISRKKNLSLKYISLINVK